MEQEGCEHTAVGRADYAGCGENGYDASDVGHGDGKGEAYQAEGHHTEEEKGNCWVQDHIPFDFRHEDDIAEHVANLDQLESVGVKPRLVKNTF